MLVGIYLFALISQVAHWKMLGTGVEIILVASSSFFPVEASKELISSFCKGLLTWDENKSNKGGCVVTKPMKDSFSF